MKTYTELITLPTFEERFEYLKLSSGVGIETFGHDRYLNQLFYNTPEWKRIRREVIIRDTTDCPCDLAHPDRPLFGAIYVHHINPITVEDVVNRSSSLFDLDNLVIVSFNTHQAIHYGDKNLLIPSKPVERKPFDQCPWR